MELPLLVSGNQQRDITQFSNLLPGAQLNPGGRSSIIGGTEQRLGEEYLDGIALTTISQQGDNRPVFNVVPMEAISGIQVVTSGYSAEYEGAGFENYTLKSGTNKYHGTVADFIRNTIFDSWGFTAPWATITNAAGVKGFQNAVGSKPVDHQNELSISFGGPVIIPHFFNGRDKLFIQGTYDKLHSRAASTYSFDTLPTAQMPHRATSANSCRCRPKGDPGLAHYDSDLGILYGPQHNSHLPRPVRLQTGRDFRPCRWTGRDWRAGQCDSRRGDFSDFTIPTEVSAPGHEHRPYQQLPWRHPRWL